MQALLTLCLIVTAPDAPKGKDAAAIEGTWVVMSATQDGKEVSDFKGGKLNFKDGKLTMDFKDTREKHAIYKLDPSAKPKALDLIHEGKAKGLFIYEFDDDKLILCFADEGTRRPKDFTAKKGDGHVLLKLKREKK